MATSSQSKKKKDMGKRKKEHKVETKKGHKGGRKRHEED
jgi:hypothetical protein